VLAREGIEPFDLTVQLVREHQRGELRRATGQVESVIAFGD
jgi:hypothetical protein